MVVIKIHNQEMKKISINTHKMGKVLGRKTIFQKQSIIMNFTINPTNQTNHDNNLSSIRKRYFFRTNLS